MFHVSVIVHDLLSRYNPIISSETMKLARFLQDRKEENGHSLWSIMAISLQFMIVVCMGCEFRPQTREGATASRLNHLKNVIITLVEHGANVNDTQSMSDLIALGVRHDVIGDLKSERERTRLDDWGNPFSYKVRKTENSVMITIISAGYNGVLEDGAGDDLAVELRISHSQQVFVSYNQNMQRRGHGRSR